MLAVSGHSLFTQPDELLMQKGYVIVFSSLVMCSVCILWQHSCLSFVAKKVEKQMGSHCWTV